MNAGLFSTYPIQILQIQIKFTIFGASRPNLIISSLYLYSILTSRVVFALRKFAIVLVISYPRLCTIAPIQML